MCIRDRSNTYNFFISSFGSLVYSLFKAYNEIKTLPFMMTVDQDGDDPVWETGVAPPGLRRSGSLSG